MSQISSNGGFIEEYMNIEKKVNKLKDIVNNIIKETLNEEEKCSQRLKSTIECLSILEEIETQNKKCVKIYNMNKEMCNDEKSKDTSSQSKIPSEHIEPQTEDGENFEKQLSFISSQLSSFSINDSKVELKQMSNNNFDKLSIKSKPFSDDNISKWSEDNFNFCGDVKLYIKVKGAENKRMKYGKVTYSFKEFGGQKYLHVKCINSDEEIFFDCNAPYDNFSLFNFDDYVVIKIKPCTVINYNPIIKTFVLKFCERHEGSCVFKYIFKKAF